MTATRPEIKPATVDPQRPNRYATGPLLTQPECLLNPTIHTLFISNYTVQFYGAVYRHITCRHDSVGAGCSEATIDVREILNVAVRKDWDVNVVTVNNQQQAHNDSTRTKHSAPDIS